MFSEFLRRCSSYARCHSLRAMECRRWRLKVVAETSLSFVKLVCELSGRGAMQDIIVLNPPTRQPANPTLRQSESKGTSMSTVVIEHVAFNELPAAWRNRLELASDSRVTVRIEEEESEATASATAIANNPLFGMWQGREDTRDVAAYVRGLREPRYRIDGARNGG